MFGWLMSMCGKMVKLVFKYGLYIVLLIAVPLLFIWSMNVLIGVNLPYNAMTWMAAAIFIGIPIVVIVFVVRRL